MPFNSDRERSCLVGLVRHFDLVHLGVPCRHALDIQAGVGTGYILLNLEEVTFIVEAKQKLLQKR